MATLIAYSDKLECTVRLTGGKVARHISYNQFKAGNIRTPSDWRYRAPIKTSCGLYAKFVRLLDIDTESGIFLFEDGERGTAKLHNAKVGHIRHPRLYYSGNHRAGYLGFTCQRGYREEDGTVWYKTIDDETGEKALLTPQMMMEKRGVKPRIKK